MDLLTILTAEPTPMSGWEIVLKIVIVLAGLGIFLYGIDKMGDSLKAFAGDKLKVFIEKTTNTPLKGILVGTLVTALIQSSSGTTALAVGLVRAGMLSFPQAIGIIMGANIGTTITAFMVGISDFIDMDTISLVCIAIGAIVVFFLKKPKINQLGSIVLGFGLLFYGLGLMGDSLKQVLEDPNISDGVEKAFKFVSDIPPLGLLIGIGVTAVVQSSSATTSIVQDLYGGGTLPLMGALPILLGCNIGTTITAVFAAAGGGSSAKRTALVHTLFNFIGSLLFLCLLWPYEWFVNWIED